MDMISRKAWRKTQCESNINTFAEELVSLENIGSYRYQWVARYIMMILLLSMMEKVYHQPFLNKLLNNLKLLNNQFRNT